MIVNRIEAYGVVLKRLTEDKIEMVRNWRNDPKIQQYMFFRDYITPEMQKAWFKRIDNEYNHYFIVEIEGKEIGLANVKDVDYEKKCGESGLFIYDDEYLDGVYSYQISFAMGDFVFQTLELETLYAVVEKNNKRAIDYNLSLGLSIEQNPDENSNVVHVIRRKNDPPVPRIRKIKQMLAAAYACK